MDRDEKLYFDNSMSFDEVLETISWNDMPFYYKNRAYNITMSGSPCVAVLDEGFDVWDKEIKNYSTYEELLLNHVFSDGTKILDAFKDMKNLKMY